MLMSEIWRNDKMETMKKYPGIVVLIIAIVLLVGLTTFTNDVSNTNDMGKTKTPISDQQDKDKAAKNESGPKDTTNEAKTDLPVPTPSNIYVARPGDTYAELARKAIQTYGIVNKINLSEAQIIAAETDLSAKAGFPELDINQIVEFSSVNVQVAVAFAQNLTANQLIAWQTYVSSVDFNTNDNGEMTGGSTK